MPVKVGGLKLITDREQILKALIQSKLEGNVLAFQLKGEEDLITTAVENIEQREGELPLITLLSIDLHGYPISRHQVFIAEIESVIQFKTLFNAPVYVHIRERRKIDVQGKAA